MRILLALALAIAVAGCSQTGSLYLPDEGVETPVEIRGPGEAAAPAPAAQKPAEEKKEDKPAQPPGR
jgi:predicted small lipoprotein YifL